MKQSGQCLAYSPSAGNVIIVLISTCGFVPVIAHSHLPSEWIFVAHRDLDCLFEFPLAAPRPTPGAGRQDESFLVVLVAVFGTQNVKKTGEHTHTHTFFCNFKDDHRESPREGRQSAEAALDGAGLLSECGECRPEASPAPLEQWLLHRCMVASLGCLWLLSVFEGPSSDFR